MTIDARQLERHRRSFEKHYFTNGSSITIKVIGYTTNNRGDNVDGVETTSTIKGFLLSNKDAEYLTIGQIQIPDSALSVLVPYDTTVMDNSSNLITLVVNSVSYKVFREETVGLINGFNGYYKLLLLTTDI